MIRKCILIFCVFTFVAIEARRVLLRPIPAAEIRRILKEANQEDAVPEGRVISHGLAAIKGFALGFKKGVIGVAIVDGLAALSSSSSNSSSSSSSNGGDINKGSFSYNGTSNELCFTSRSATSDIVASGDAREISTTGTATGSGIAMDIASPTVDTSGTGSDTNTNTETNTATTTEEDPEKYHCIVINKT